MAAAIKMVASACLRRKVITIFAKAENEAGHRKRPWPRPKKNCLKTAGCILCYSPVCTAQRNSFVWKFSHTNIFAVLQTKPFSCSSASRPECIFGRRWSIIFSRAPQAKRCQISCYLSIKSQRKALCAIIYCVVVNRDERKRSGPSWNIRKPLNTYCNWGVWWA